MAFRSPQPANVFWNAVANRNRQYDGSFVYVAVTTGIYCRPSCPARHPHRRNVLVFRTPLEAEQRGYMACRRCHPSSDALTPAESSVKAALEYIAAHLDRSITLTTLSQVSGLSPNHLQQTFKRIVGVSPKSLVDAQRVARLKQSLKAGVSVSTASYDVGFGSSRALYERAGKSLGMTPATYARGGAGVRVAYALAGASLGRVLVAGTKRGICNVLVGRDDRALMHDLRAELPKALLFEDVGLGCTWRRAVSSCESEDPLLARLPDTIRLDVFRAKLWKAIG